MKNPNDNKRRKEITPIKEAIEQFFKSHNIGPAFDEAKIIASWPELMGKTIADRTHKVFIKDRTIFVKVISAPLKNELSMSQTKIIEMLNKFNRTDYLQKMVLL